MGNAVLQSVIHWLLVLVGVVVNKHLLNFTDGLARVQSLLK